MNSVTGHPLAQALPGSNFGAGSLARSTVELAVQAPPFHAEACAAAGEAAAEVGAAHVLRLMAHGDARSNGTQERRRGLTDIVLLPDSDGRELSGAHADIVLLSGVLERLQDPRPVLRTLKGLMLSGGTTRLLLAVTDRQTRETPSEAHHREWTRSEFERFLSAHGFQVRFKRLLAGGGLMFETGLSPESYEGFLEQHSLPSGDLRELYISTRRDGAPASSAVLLLGHAEPPFTNEKWITPANLGFTSLEQSSDNALKVLQHLLPYYPRLRRLDIEEFGGVGARILQARRSGMLPSSLEVHVHCHGGHVHLEDTEEKWQNASKLQVITEERLSVELADRVIFPTDALAQSYELDGYRIDPARKRVQSDGRSTEARGSAPRPLEEHGRISVIVPCFKTDFRFIDDLVWSLNQQTLQPAKVVFVDDGSGDEYAAHLEARLRASLRLQFEIVRHPENRGLPAARNTALSRVDTEYAVNIDSDDVAKNDFLRRYVDALDADPAAAAATSYADYFPDGTDWALVKNTEPEGYRPYGAGVIQAQFENCLGHANSAFRTSVLREVGGWDARDNSKWEDYALLLALVSSGRRVAVVPRATWLYRYRPDSMVRTYSKFPAERRVARALRGLDSFEARRLKAVIITQQERIAALEEKYRALEEDFGRARYRSVRELVELVERQPQVFRAIRGVHHRVTLLLEAIRGKRHGDR